MTDPDIEVHMDEHEPLLGPAEAVFGLGLLTALAVAITVGSGQRWVGYAVAFVIAGLVCWAAIQRVRARRAQVPP